MTTYNNPWHDRHSVYSREKYTNDKPVEYKGYFIFKEREYEFHIVKDGVCVGMNAGINGAKKRIDTGEPKLLK
jgi:hypothetical protein